MCVWKILYGLLFLSWLKFEIQKKSYFLNLFLVKKKSYWKNCLKVQEHAYRRVMDMDGVSISCQNEQGWIINHFQHALALLLCFFLRMLFPDSLELWRFVQFCQILTFSKYQNLVLIKISLYKIFFPNKIWALKDSNAKNLSKKSPLNKKLQSQELVYF